jgi:excisionase family DNA binding protein
MSYLNQLYPQMLSSLTARIPSPEMPGELLTTTEAAQLLGVVRSTVLRYVRTGKLPAISLPSGHTRIRREDVERLLQDPHRDR